MNEMNEGRGRWWLTARVACAAVACSWLLASSACNPDNGGSSPDSGTVTDGSTVTDGGAGADSSTGTDGAIADGPGASQPDGGIDADEGGAGDGGTGNDSGASDPYFSNVVLLMHFDGANGSTNFVDVKGHAVAPKGSAALSATTSAFGGASGHFDGTSAYLSMNYSDDWNFHAADFTVELFVNFTGGVAGQPQSPDFFGFWGPNQGWQLFYDHANPGNDVIAGTLNFIFSLTGTDEIPAAAAWTPVANTWYHLASVRHGADFLLFVNGSLIGSQTLGADGGPLDWMPVSGNTWAADSGVSADASINANTGTSFTIGTGVGSNSVPNPQTYFNGYMDEVRITKGVARYTSNFMAPTQEFANQ